MSTENTYEVWWWGPYTLETLKNEDKDYLGTISLYAIYDDHPLYGRQVLTYIGQSRRNITKRLSEHDLTTEQIYVANVCKFENWEKSDSMFDFKTHLDSFLKKQEEAKTVIDDIEALLIHALRPADNKRNKNTANRSWDYRIFNTGHVGSIPHEISGRYTLYSNPIPDRVEDSEE